MLWGQSIIVVVVSSLRHRFFVLTRKNEPPPPFNLGRVIFRSLAFVPFNLDEPAGLNLPAIRSFLAPRSARDWNDYVTYIACSLRPTSALFSNLLSSCDIRVPTSSRLVVNEIY